MSLQEQLDQAVRDTGVVGAAIAVLDGDRIESAVAGTANSRTGAPVTPATRFGIWSLTKPMTAMVLFRLAAAGHLNLDDPVAVHVPELLASEHGEGLLVHHLLECNNGLPGLHFPATGDDAGALAAVLPTMRALPRVHEPGDRFAYSNLGFVVAAIIAERRTRRIWDELLRELVLDPIEMSNSLTAYEGGLPAQVAADHQVASDGTVSCLDNWYPRSSGPAGGTVLSTVEDLCALGTAIASDRWSCLREPQVRFPGPHVESWGRGLAIYGWGAAVVGWDGMGPGTRAYLRVMPDHGGVLAILVNSANGRDLYRAVVPELMRERWGVRAAAERPVPLDDPNASRRLVEAVVPGEFRTGDLAASLARDGDQLTLQVGIFGPDPVELLPTGGADGTEFVADVSQEYPVVELNGDFLSAVFGFRRRR